MARADLVYVGTYSEPILFGTGQVLKGKGKGIYCFRFDADAGRARSRRRHQGVRNSSYLAFDPTRKFLYCVNEFKEFEGKASGAVSAFRIDRDSGKLTFLNMKASRGTDPCHLIVDKTGRNVLIANFASGSVCVLPIEPRRFARRTRLLHTARRLEHRPEAAGGAARSRGRDRRSQPVTSSCRSSGADKVMIYELDAETGSLTPNKQAPFVASAPGAGPRQLVIHPNGKFAYLINELNSTMTAYGYDAGEAERSKSCRPCRHCRRTFMPISCAEVQIAAFRSISLRLEPRP